MSVNKVSLKQSGVVWLWLAMLIFVADIALKVIVMSNMGYGPANRIELFPFFNLMYVHNYGAAFSFLSDQSGWQRWFFTSIAFVVIGVLIHWMRQLSASDKWNNIAYTLIIGGALGNGFDRIIHGYVVDYLDFYWQSYHWPAFNLADMTICIGATMVIIDSVKNPNSRHSQGQKEN